MGWGIFAWHTFGPLVANEGHLNASVLLRPWPCHATKNWGNSEGKNGVKPFTSKVYVNAVACECEWCSQVVPSWWDHTWPMRNLKMCKRSKRSNILGSKRHPYPTQLWHKWHKEPVPAQESYSRCKNQNRPPWVYSHTSSCSPAHENTISSRQSSTEEALGMMMEHDNQTVRHKVAAIPSHTPGCRNKKYLEKTPIWAFFDERIFLQRNLFWRCIEGLKAFQLLC